VPFYLLLLNRKLVETSHYHRTDKTNKILIIAH
jgi:hypothetical protein